VASQLLSEGKSLRAAIWAWKHAAQILDKVEPAIVCLEVMMACKQLGDPELVQQELIPWAEDALARPGSEAQWSRALGPLLWAYEYVGEATKAVERGRYWLKQGQQRDVPLEQMALAKLRFAELLIGVGQVDEAAQMLREIVQAGPEWIAESAQMKLLKLAQAHREIGDVAILPPKLKRVWPQKLQLTLKAGEQIKRTIMVMGNPTLELKGVSCDVEFAETGTICRTLEEQGTAQEVSVTVGPAEKAGKYEGTILLDTNDPEKAQVGVPIAVEVLSPITVRPASFFFGFAKPGETKTATVTLSGTVPFEITGTKVDRPELIAVEVTRQQDDSYLVKASLEAPAQPCTLEGDIELSTGLQSQPSAIIRYYAQISAVQ